MIVIVDDDPALGEFVNETLKAANFSTKVFDDANAALEFLTDNEPELVISDVMMPAMGGFDFKREYARRHPNRLTPFLFLSSMQDSATMIEGLELGANDFLNKPIDAALLAAKVKSHLRQARRYSRPIFRGDLAKFPFIKVLQFCETQGLTGSVEVSTGTFDTVVHFRAGTLDASEEGADDMFEQLLETTSGTFVISADPTTFAEIADAAVTVEAADVPAGEPIMGRLSGIKVNGRMLQVQSEVTLGQSPRVVSIVILDGRTLLKTSSDPVGGMDRDAVQVLIRDQHDTIEKRIHEKLGKLGDADSGDDEDAASKKKLDSLMDAALNKYLERDFEGSLTLWQEASQLDPNNKTVALNIDVIKKKLES